MTLGIETLGLLLLIAAIVAMMTRKLHVPYSVGLVTTGIVLAFLPVHMEISLTKELIFSMLLPPLIFEAAYFLHWQELRRDFWLITTLASAGVLISAAVTAAGMHYLSGWQWTGAMIFGVLIAATDPVSVIATFKEAGVKGRLRILVEAESLFNDGTAAVLFSIAVAIAAGQVVTPEFVSMALIKTIGGGIGCGALIAGAALLLAGRTQDHLVEITLTTVAAYGSFLLAEHFNLSGVLATLTTGLMMGSIGQRGAISPHGNEAVEAFWEYIAFVANSLIFLLIGIRETQQNFSAIWVVILTAILLVLIGDLSDLLVIFGQQAESGAASSAHLGLGWLARRTGIGTGTRAS
jgi:CPA1 family monovalent cation:H+ antiporter